MEKIKLEIIGMSFSQLQNGAYALILGETEGTRRLPIIIGGFEAQSIALELEKMKPSRPLTHDLFKTFSLSFGITLKEVIIHRLAEGIFYAYLICTDGDREVEIDSRTSDAVALALRFKCPIYTTPEVLDSAAVEMIDIDPEETENKKGDFDFEEEDFEKEFMDMADEDDEDEEETKEPYDLSELTNEELQIQMEKAIMAELYEKASLIRDELKRRSRG